MADNGEKVHEGEYVSPMLKQAWDGKQVVFPMPQEEQKPAQAAAAEEAAKKDQSKEK